MMETKLLEIILVKNDNIISIAHFDTISDMIIFIHALGLNSKHEMRTILDVEDNQSRVIML